MLFLDHRMVEGSPLHYYPYAYSFPTSQPFPYFRRFETHSRMSEEFIMPSSPNSMQSDSDASISSIDIHPEPIQRKLPSSNPQSNKNVESRCCWQNCGILFDSLDRLSDHVSKVHAISGLGGLYYCGWDGCSRNNKGFNARYKMLVHVRTHTNEKPHQCTLCQKSFSRAENLKIHIRSHSGERPYVCPVPGCNKAYSNSSDRFKHTRTHQVDKPYQCKVPGCPKKYTDPSSLRKHVKTYKHFVNENANQIKNENLDNPRLKPLEYKEMAKDNEIRQNSVIVEQPYENSSKCNCNRNCYLSKCMEMNNYLNIRNELKQPWNSYIEPYYTSYQLKQNQIDVDLPLDLSIRRHI